MNSETKQLAQTNGPPLNVDQTVKMPERYCTVTITCDEFAIGTEVLLYSLLRHNPWYTGDIIIVIAELAQEYRDRLLAIYPVKFIQASAALTQKVSVLRRHFDHLNDIHLRFYSLEAFNQPDYERVVYLDSDMHCAGDVKALFATSAPLLACLDGFSYEERIAPMVAQAGFHLPTCAKRYGQSFTNSFNAGVISCNPSQLPQNHFSDLIEMLDYDAWLSYGDSIFTDQMVINRYFADQFEIISSDYNYMVFLGSYLQYVDQLLPQQAKIVHFAGKIKPWNNYSTAELLSRAPHYIPFIEQWRSLLNAARNHNNLKYQAQQVMRQYQWIEQGADHGLQHTGRLY